MNTTKIAEPTEPAPTEPEPTEPAPTEPEPTEPDVRDAGPEPAPTPEPKRVNTRPND